MKTRVNLTIDENVLHDAKLYAEKHGVSVSEIVEEYLKKITRPVKRRTIIDMIEEFGPSTIDPKADLKELYYQERAEKYGF
ncbi:MAG: hypothetical protein JST32_19000 [Bacteroidetes bacterium]|nr:hypothetical protein [Bacteroidota bacterium]